jgi:hypothetical protein
LAVETITVDEDYRGQGLAKALYGIVLTIMKRPLTAGSAQTPGGRRNWLSLANTPGVEVKGIIQVDHDNPFTNTDDFTDQLMQLGGQFIGQDKYASCWAFDVVPGKGELKPYIKNTLSKIYDEDGPTTLLATWSGNASSINEAKGGKLVIFDIDDTLLHTTAKIRVVSRGRVVRELTNQQFNHYKLQPDEEFDFGEFRNAEKFNRESEPIKPMVRKLKTILINSPNSDVIMLTARADFDDKELFLKTFRDLGIDMSRVHVHRAGNLPGDAIPAEKKAVWVRKYLNTDQYDHVRLYDDSVTNLTVFKELRQEYPGVDFRAVYVGPEGNTKPIEEDEESYEIDDGNDPPGPESPPKFPAGTVKVDVSDVYDWYKLGQGISDIDDMNKKDFGQGPPSTVLAFGSEELENQYIEALKSLGLPVHDLDEPGEEPSARAGSRRARLPRSHARRRGGWDGPGPARRPRPRPPAPPCPRPCWR